MDCDSAREAISARIDGEEPRAAGHALDAHLPDCVGCREWQQRAHSVTRRARLGGAFLDHDLTPRVLAAAPAAGPPRWRKLAPRCALVVVALSQLAIAVPMLFLGHDHDAGVHAAHELGSFNLALAIAFAVGAIRPALSAGLAWPCSISAAAAGPVSDGHYPASDGQAGPEATHGRATRGHPAHGHPARRGGLLDGRGESVA